MIKWILALLPFSFLTSAQSFAPEPGVQGSSAIFKDSSIIIDWATGISLERGYLTISDQGLGLVTYGQSSDALGAADNMVVSLGDSGVAILTFTNPVANGAGPDFVVFENGFIDHYMEFAFVEVSSDGVNFFRFNAVSEIPTSTQIDNFSTSDCRMVNNLAGKYRVFYGTPFDLEELSNEAGLNVNQITHLRLIDVVGSIDPQFGSVDGQGNLINDPCPTPFESGGFDLDAVGVIHNTLSLEENFISVSVSPNPISDILKIQSGHSLQFQLMDSFGKEVLSGNCVEEKLIDVSRYLPGLYILVFEEGQRFKLMIE